MSIKITLKNNTKDNQVKNYVLFCDENFKINGLNKLSLNKQSKLINDSIQSNNLKKKDIIFFNINPIQKIFICCSDVLYIFIKKIRAKYKI